MDVGRSYWSFVLAIVSCGFIAVPRQATAMPSVTQTVLTITSGGNPVTTVKSGTVVTLTAMVKPAVTVGEVQFCDATAKYCTDIHVLGGAQLTAAGTAKIRFSPSVGTHSYTAIFRGTNSYSPSISSAGALEVTGLLPTTTTIGQSGSVGNYTLTAAVTGWGKQTPSGTVSFLDTSNSNSVLGGGMLGQGSSNLYWLPQTLATGQFPVSIAAADLNGDGFPDLAVVNGNDNTVTVQLGNGDGTFTQEAASPATGVAPTAIAAADFNGDGIPDLAVACENLPNGPGSVTILLGKGDGTFTQVTVSPTVGYVPSSLAVGDFNGDGIPDLAVANYEAGSVTIVLGNGDGTFTAASVNPSTGGDPLSIAVADFNGDGKADLAVANSIDGTVTILLGNGDGTFTAASKSPTTGYQPASIAIADFNADGKADIAVSNFGTLANSLTILLGNGDGTFIPAPSVATGSQPYQVVAGDFNGDGIVDLAVANTAGFDASVLLGNGDGTFLPVYAPAAGWYPYSLAVADFNGDGVPDLAAANSGTSPATSNATVLLTQWTHTAVAEITGVALPGSGSQEVVGNYSGDSNFGASVSTAIPVPPVTSVATLAVTAGGSVVTSVGSGTALTLTATVSAGGTPVAKGEVKFCDVMPQRCTDTHVLGVAQLTSAGTAKMSFVPGVGVHSLLAVFAGVNGVAGSVSGASAVSVSGKEPSITGIAAIGSPGGYTLTATVGGEGTAALPTGTVTFVDTSNGNELVGTAALGGGGNGLSWVNSQTPSVQSQPQSLAAADLNGDGIPDVVVANYEYDSVTVLLGKGDGTFTTALGPATGQLPSSVVVGDFNRDGIPDLAVSNAYDSDVTILLGKGDGTFTASAVSPNTGYWPYSVAVGDFNGDGIQDLAVANQGSNSLTILLGKGDGSFTASVESPLTGVTPNWVAVGDFNGDGISDLAVASREEGTVTILLGKGDGTFSTAAGLSVGPSPLSISVVITDFNRDGKVDLAVGSNSTVTVFLGNGDGTFTAETPISPGLNLPGSLTVGDVNGDGIPDLIVPSNSTYVVGPAAYTYVYVLLGKGDGTFATTSFTVTGDGPVAAALGDFNGDGLVDVAVLNIYSDNVSVMLTEPGNTVATVGPITLSGTGTHQVIARYGGDNNYTTSASAPTALEGTGITIWGAPIIVSAGATAGNTSMITVTPSGGFTGNVTLTAAITSSPTGAQDPPTLSFGATSPVSISGTSVVTATLTITTTAPTSGALAYTAPQGVRWYAASGMTLAFGLLFGICVPSRRPRWRTWSGFVFLLILAGGLLACGGGSSSNGSVLTSNRGTTPGLYTITVTGTSGSTTAKSTVTLTVQ